MATHDHHHHAHHHGGGGYRFCPRCAGALAPRVLKSGEPERLVCEKCSFIFYQDPKVVAGTICTLEGGVVLLRRGIEPAMGKWVFPGGYVDRGESTAEAAVRETREESRLEVVPRSLLGVYSYSGSPNVIIVYVADVVGGTLAAGDESTEAGAFPLSRVPWDDLAFPSTVEALKDFGRLYGEGELC